MATIKIKISGQGQPTLANPHALRGYAGDSPIIEIVGCDGVQPRAVIAAYRKCIILPLMHADIPVSWDKIKDACQGQFVRLEQ